MSTIQNPPYIRLGINLDHMATLRNARTTSQPLSLARAAHIALSSGAQSITVHLREDRRHIQDSDLEALQHLPLNLEMATTEEMLSIALKFKPPSCCLVPEKRLEQTTEGGLDLESYENIRRLELFVQTLRNQGIHVSLFINPTRTNIEAAKKLNVWAVELHTGPLEDKNLNSQDLEAFKKNMETCAHLAHMEGIRVHAGHGLNFSNIHNMSTVPWLEEVNIGYALVCEALFMGWRPTVKRMRKMLDKLHNPVLTQSALT